MHRYMLNASALSEYTSDGNPFGHRRASLASGLSIGHGKKRPHIKIVLHDQPPEFRIPSYTTRERIVGHVEITAANDIAFDDLHITLQGTSRTWVERIATTAPTNPRTRAFHTFLRLMQPIEESAMPEQHILRGGRTYTIPFEFVIPERLLPQACSHPRENQHVADEHLKLPPSMGDVMVSGDGKSLHADHAPEMTTISYCLRCIVTRTPTSGTSRRPVLLGDEQKKLRIIPRYDELPPLAISDEPGEDYVMHRSKSVKKGILMGKNKIGRLHVEAKQPAAFRLPPVRAAADPDACGAVMTIVNVKLRFEPCKSTTKPPKLHMLWSRLKVATFFATIPQKNVPSKSAAFSVDSNKGLMVETLPLSALNLSGVAWVKRQAERRDSGFAFTPRTGSIDANTSPDDSPVPTPRLSPTPSPATTPASEDPFAYTYYTADVTVPIELPQNKHAFIPTFHTCLISRVYALDLSLSATTGAANTTNVHLKVPVQITSTGSANPVPIDGMIPEGGFASARTEHRDVYAPNMSRADGDDEAPPDFDDLSIHENGGRVAAASDQPEVDSDGEINFRRPTWTNVESMGGNDPASLAAELDRQHLQDDETPTSGALSPGTRTPAIRSPLESLSSSPRQALRRAPASTGARSSGARSPSPRQQRLTNDQILHTEEYEYGDNAQGTNASPEAQFGTFTFEPQNFTRPGEGANRGEVSNGEWRRASEVLPPGYASVAAGTMLMGSGGMVRALS